MYARDIHCINAYDNGTNSCSTLKCNINEEKKNLAVLFTKVHVPVCTK